ncbi:hypothetical protein ACFV6Z_18680 [Streptomyces sp. NPDC059818]|uniref:hypothetical protein n=1 Tax=Streptomyces sp. NPDC059818 TaxID=3346962 RepID=UPI00366431E7
MALGRYTEVARSANGDLIRAGEVTVYAAGTTDLAELWQDDAGTVPAPNPGLTDLASGAWSVVAEAGLYDLLYPGGRTVHNVPIAAAGGDAAAVAWGDITDKPSTFAPTIGATASTAVAGNDARLVAAAAGTASVRAIGATGTTVVAGNDARLSAAAAGTASVRALAGGTATTASASDHTHTGLLTGTTAALNNAAEFTDLATATTAYNALLAALRLRGIISGT